MSINVNHQAKGLRSKGLSAARAGDLTDAIRFYEEALALQPSDADLVKEITRLLQDVRKQAGIVAGQTGDSAKRAQANLSKGLSAMRAGDLDDAVRYFEMVLDDEPDNQQAASLTTEARKKRRAYTGLAPAGQGQRTSGWIIGGGAILLLLLLLTIYVVTRSLSTNVVATNVTATSIPSTLVPTSEGSPTTMLVSPLPTDTPVDPPTNTPVPPAPTIESFPSGAVIASILNLRTGPGINYPLKYPNAKLGSGATVEILSSNSGVGCDSANNTWYEVRLPDNTVGYVCAAYVRLS